MKKIVKKCELGGGGTPELEISPEVRNFEGDAALHFVLVNLFQDCIDILMKRIHLSPKHQRVLSLVKKSKLCHNSDMEHHNNRLASLKRKCAFTLAEVLITLAIIGVVAAMTIPTLLNKYQMKVFETAFKKQYSVFQNAINYTVLENGISECYIYYPEGTTAYHAKNQDCDSLRESLVSLIKLTPVNLDYSSYNYTRKEDVLANGGRTVNAACTINDFCGQNHIIYTYMTNDGAIVRLALRKDYYPVIIFDVNGLKGPNKWGYDVFFMTLSKRDRNGSLEQKIYLTDEYCSIVEKGGRLPRTILQNKEKTEDNDFSLFWH